VFRSFLLRTAKLTRFPALQLYWLLPTIRELSTGIGAGNKQNNRLIPNEMRIAGYFLDDSRSADLTFIQSIVSY
jgi:hypothetical protein